MSSPGFVFFPVEQGLLATGRVRTLSRAATSVRMAEWTTLILCGMAAGLANYGFKWELGLPGHAILRYVFPMIFGLSLVPRRGAGTTMGASALATMGGMYLAGFQPSPGSFTSLLAIGPLLDLAIIGARPGWRVYLRFTAAGLVANLLALAMRLTAAATGVRPLGNAGSGTGMGHGTGGGMGTGGGRGLGSGMGLGTGGGGGMGRRMAQAVGDTVVPDIGWNSRMIVSYILCGAAAGLISAVIWFRFAARETAESTVETLEDLRREPNAIGENADSIVARSEAAP